MSTREDQLLALVLATDPTKRAALLERECASDPALRQRLEAFLVAHQQTGGVLTSPPASAQSTLKFDFANAPTDEAVGRTVGRYKLLEQVGEGGCGMVYVAEQTEPIRRRVALKVIKLGMDTRQVIARFEAERQALAMMDHPNIAKVLDAGATDAGRPYFVMELVRGIRITDYCDQINLPTSERLELFIKVCQAIQHAHQKGIIHRDIKPSNILVTLHDGVPVPKVIDFGIAKATEGRLTDATVYTQLHQFIGTPAYMSPEQAEMSGLDVDTRSDIYGLGVLLYELLTGRTPFDAKELMAQGLEAMRRTIREKEPVRPSTRLATLPGDELTTTARRRSSGAPKLISLLKGDLDWIVIKCLEKDRTHRYETANGLAADITRHLNHEPVVARPPSAVYRFQKAWRRNKPLFVAGMIVGLSLLAGLLVSTWQAVRATRAEREQSRLRAETETARNREVELRLRAESEAGRAEKGEQQAKGMAAQLRLRAYAADMKAAQVAIEQNSRGQAARLLATYRPKPGEEDLRGVEWRYLWKRLCGDELATWKRQGMVWWLRCTADGLHVFSGEVHQKLQVLDSETGRVWRELDITPEFYGPIAVSSDGKLILSCENDVLSLRATLDWRLIASTGVKGVVRVAFVPDGQFIAARVPSGILLFRIGNGGEMTQELHIPATSIAGATFTSDGKQLFVAGATDGSARLREYSMPSGQELHSDSPPLETGGDLYIDPTARYLLSIRDNEMSLYLLENRKSLWMDVKLHKSFVSGVVFSKDGEQFATASHDQTTALVRTRDGALLGRLRGHQNEVWAIDASPDGRFLFTGSKDGTIKKWRWAAPPDAKRALPEQEVLVPKVRHGDPLLTFDPSSQRFSKWTGLERNSWPVPANLPSLSTSSGLLPNGCHLHDPTILAILRTNNVVTFCELSRGDIEHKVELGSGDIGGAVVSNNRQWLALIRGYSRAAPVEVWDLTAGRFVRKLLSTLDRTIEHPMPSRMLAISPDSRLLAYPDGRYEMVLWSLKQDREAGRFRGASWYLRHLSFSADGKQLAAAGAEGIIYIWDVATGRLVLPPLQGHGSGIWTVYFSRDGRTLVSAGDDNSVRFWNLANGLEMLRLVDSFSWDPLSENDSLLFLRRNWSVQDGGFLERIPNLEEIEAAENRSPMLPPTE